MSVLDYILKNEEESYGTLRLVASENLPGIRERIPYMLDMFARYSFDSGGTWNYPTFYLDDIEKETCQRMCDLLNCRYASLKPISGLNGMLATISAFTQIGDTVMSLHPHDGGHLETSLIVQKMGLKSEFLPFNRDTWKVDVEMLKQDSHLNSVQMVYLDLCMVTFAQPVKAIREILPKNTLLVYDASHVLGLILGGQFQKPLEDGADILIANTHKTFPGPHKAVYATNRKLLKWQFEQNSGRFISHHHMADVACLGLILEKYGDVEFQKYAQRIIINAKQLATLLSEAGVHVQLKSLGFTGSHQIWIECGTKEEVDRVVDLCSEAKIMINGGLIPSLNGGWGIRIGVQEITWKGIDQQGIQYLSELLADIILNHKAGADIIQKKDQVLRHCVDMYRDQRVTQEIMRVLQADERE
jgi:glycine/serine hydroxymethyltransferase